MDKLQKIYDLYLSKGLISEAINIESFSSSNPEQIQKLYDLGKDNGLFQATDINVFSSAWDEKKNPISSGAGTGQEENTESTTEIVQEDGSLVSGEKPVRERSYIEEQIDIDIEDAPQNTIITKGGNIIRTGYKDDDQGVTYDQELSDALYADTGIQRALKLGKLTEEEIKNATSNKKTVRAEALEKIKEFRYKSAEEIDEILTNENLNKPYIYEEAAVDDGFIDSVFSNAQLQGLQNFNIEDFNGFITEKGYKADYLKRLEDGNYDSNSSFQSKKNKNLMLQVLKEKDELRMITLYLEELQERDLRFQELQWRKDNKGVSASDVKFIPAQIINPNQLSEFIKQNMPNFASSINQQREKVEEQYVKMKNNKQNGLWEFAKSYGNSFDDRLNQVTASLYDVFGDSAATGVRMAEEYEAMMKDPSLQYGYVSGKEVEIGGVNYLVNADGNVFDTDAKAQVTSALDQESIKLIREEAKKNGKAGTSFSTQGIAIDTAGVLGSITVDLFLTKGASSAMTVGGGALTLGASYTGGAKIVAKSLDKLRSVPVSRGMSSSIIAQTTLGLSQGVESTLREAKVAGLNDEDAKELATIAGLEMATLYGLTGFISPQTKATELLFGGINKTTLIKEALKKYTKEGTKGFVNRFKQAGRDIAKNPINTIKNAGKEILDYGGEGAKEFIQENVQQAGERFVVNPSLNKIAGEKIMADTISGDEFINTSMLSFSAAFIMPGAGKVTSSITSLFPGNDIDKLQMLGLLNSNKDKTLQLLDTQVASGLITLKQRNAVARQMKIYAGSINLIPNNFSASTANAVMDNVYEISRLENEKEGKPKAFKAVIDKEIEALNLEIDSAIAFSNFDKETQKDELKKAKNELQKKDPKKILTDNEILKYAIQKQSTENVDAEKSTEGGKKVDENVLVNKSAGKGDPEGENKNKEKSKTKVDKEISGPPDINLPVKEKKVILKKEQKQLEGKLPALNEELVAAEKNLEGSKPKSEAAKQNAKIVSEIKKKIKLAESRIEEIASGKALRLSKEQLVESDKEQKYTAKNDRKNAKGLKEFFTSTVPNFIKRTLKQGFQMRGNKPKDVQKATETKRNYYNKIVYRASQKATTFNRLFSKIIKSAKLSPEAATKLNEDLGKVLRGEMNIKDVKFKNNKTGRMQKISPNFSKIMKGLRSDIDMLSKRILADKIANPEAAKTIESQIGSYVTRSYRLFEGDLKGQDYKASLDLDVLDGVREYLSNSKKIISQVNKEIKNTKKDFETLLKEKIEKTIDELLLSSDANGANEILRLASGGKKDGILKQKQNIAPELRKLYGEITDPVANYLSTMFKAGNLISSSNYLQSIYESGIGKYIFTENDSNMDSSTMVELDVGKDSPLAGLYTYPDVADAIQGDSNPSWMQKLQTPGKLNPSLPKSFFGNTTIGGAALTAFVAFPRASKTILSTSTQVINFFSNVSFAITNGHLPVSMSNGTIDLSSYKTAMQTNIKNLLNLSNEKLAKKIEEYYELGVIDQNVDVQELRDLMGNSESEADLFDKFTQEPAYKKNLLNALWGKSFGAIYKGAAKAYQAGDDFWKIMGYEQETKILSKVLYNKEVDKLTPKEKKELAERASENVKNSYPNYSRIPAIARFFKVFPVAGNFVSFQAESYRVGWYQLGAGFKMKNEGKKLLDSKNPEEVAKGKRLIKEGVRKIFNLVTYMGAREAAVWGTAKVLGGKVLGGVLPLLGIGGFDDEKEEDSLLSAEENAYRNFVPYWMKNSQIVVLPSNPGEIEYLDFTTFDPYQIWYGNLNAALQAESVGGAAYAVLLNNFETFASPDFVGQAFVDSYENYKKKGTARNIYTDLFQPYLTRSSVPGALLNLEDALGKEFVSGRNITESNKLKLIGYRSYKSNITTQLYFNLEPGRKDQMLGEKAFYNNIDKWFENRGQGITDDDKKSIRDLYKKVNISKQKDFLYVFEQIRYALILGASWKSIERTLKGSKINLNTKKIMEVMKRKPSLINPIPSWRRSNNSKDDVIDLDLDLDLDVDIDLLKDVDL